VFGTATWHPARTALLGSPSAQASGGSTSLQRGSRSAHSQAPMLNTAFGSHVLPLFRHFLCHRQSPPHTKLFGTHLNSLSSHLTSIRFQVKRQLLIEGPVTGLTLAMCAIQMISVRTFVHSLLARKDDDCNLHVPRQRELALLRLRLLPDITPSSISAKLLIITTLG